MPVVTNFIQDIESAIAGSKLENLLNAGIILSGGGALLPGLIEHIEKATRLPARMGKAYLETRHLSNPAFYTACIGLAQELLPSSTSDLFSLDKNATVFARLLTRTKELYQEYF